MEDEFTVQGQPSFLGRGWSFPPTFDRDLGGVQMLEQEDDIIAATWLTKGGEVVNESVKELLAKQGGQD